MKVRSSLLCGVILLLVLAACAPSGRAAQGPGTENTVEVVVRNDNLHQATVYAVVNSARVRLGEVPGNSQGIFVSPSPMAGQMHVEVRLLGVGSFTSFPVQAVTGEQVRVTVPANLHRYRGRPR